MLESIAHHRDRFLYHFLGVQTGGDLRSFRYKTCRTDFSELSIQVRGIQAGQGLILPTMNISWDRWWSWGFQVVFHTGVENQVATLIESKLDVIAFDFTTNGAEANSGFDGVFDYGKPQFATLVARFGSELRQEFLLDRTLIL